MARESTPPTNRGKKSLIVILIVANLLMLVIAIVTIPPNLRGMSERSGSSAESSRVTTTVMQESEAMYSTDTVDTVDGVDSIDTVDSTDTADAPDPSLEAGIPQVADVDLSTDQRPDLGDFLWYTESVFYDGIPNNAAFIEEFEVLTGGWKGLIIYDPENEHGENAMEFLNVNIAGKSDNLNLTLDWYLMFIAGVGESFDETDMEDSVFNGKWEANGLWASGAGTIRLTQFYELNNKQYAVGTMDTPDGIPAIIALVRP